MSTTATTVEHAGAASLEDAASRSRGILSIGAQLLSGRVVATIQMDRADTIGTFRNALEETGRTRRIGDEQTSESLAQGSFAMTFNGVVLKDRDTVLSAALSDGDVITIVHLSPLRRFRSAPLSPLVVLSADCTEACHTDPSGEELHGVVFGDGPLPHYDVGAYFEVRVQQTRYDQVDGLVLGVTETPPDNISSAPQAADEVPQSWSIGYDGLALLEGRELPVSWCPQVLDVGDKVSLLVTPTGNMLAFVNDELKADVCAQIPWGPQLYAFVDLLGSAKAVSLIPGASPSRQLVAAMSEADKKTGRMSPESADEIEARTMLHAPAFHERATPTANNRRVLSGFAPCTVSERMKINPSYTSVRRIGTAREQFFGAVVSNGPARVFAEGCYFEIMVDHVFEDVCVDGLAIGFTATTPLKISGSGLPECADEVPSSWLVGYDGTFICNATCEDAMPVDWRPAELQVGDTVGALATPDGEFLVFQNQQIVARVPADNAGNGVSAQLPPPHVPLYALLDVLGSARGVTLLLDAKPPPAAARTRLRLSKWAARAGDAAANTAWAAVEVAGVVGSSAGIAARAVRSSVGEAAWSVGNNASEAAWSMGSSASEAALGTLRRATIRAALRERLRRL